MDAPEITILSESSSPDPETSPPTVIPPRPRLRSPYLFRDIFAENISPGVRSEASVPPVNYQETLQDVRSALQNADMAVRNAQEAFRTGRTSSSRHSIVDLTGSPPQVSNDDSFMSHTLHPHDSNRGMSAIRNATNSLHEPIYGNEHFTGPSLEPADAFNTGVHEHHLYAIENDLSRQFLASFDLPTLLNPPLPSEHRQTRAGDYNRRQDAAAVRRQRQARRDWERVQRRFAQRVEEESRQEEARQINLPPSPEMQPSQSFNNMSSRPSTADGISQVDGNGSEMSPVDLTQVEDDSTLAEALSKQRQDAIDSQKQFSQESTSKDSVSGSRTTFSAFRCTICMEPPTNATTTICGHLFCHRCIIDSLKWSEQLRREEHGRASRGLCPVCRKPLSAKDVEGPNRGLVPLEIKLVSRDAFRRQTEQRKEQNTGKEKAKSKVEAEDIDQVLRDSADGARIKKESQTDLERKRKRETTDEELFGEFLEDGQF